MHQSVSKSEQQTVYTGTYQCKVHIPSADLYVASEQRVRDESPSVSEMRAWMSGCGNEGWRVVYSVASENERERANEINDSEKRLHNLKHKHTAQKNEVSSTSRRQARQQPSAPPELYKPDNCSSPSRATYRRTIYGRYVCILKA